MKYIAPFIFAIVFLLAPELARTEEPQSDQQTVVEQEADATDAAEFDRASEEEAPQHIPDPLAPFNKTMFMVNDRLYFWLLKPVTQGYARIPDDFRIVFGNMYDNLWAPKRALNNFLQLRLKRAGNELVRFVLNTVLGIGGIGDAARDVFGISKQEADFGQTLGRYGIGHGFYLVFPLFGPSSLRDGIGVAGDRFMHPLTYVDSSDLTFWQSAGISLHEKINAGSFRLGEYEEFKEAAIDPYIAMRDAFTQHRKKKVDEARQDFLENSENSRSRE